MCKKRVVTSLLAAAFSLSLPLSSIAEQTGQASTAAPKVAQTTAKSKQAMAAKKAPKRTPKKPVKKAAHRRTTKSKT
jgi:hypothetical protein